MQDWQRERKEKLADLTLGAHIIAYLIAVAVFICNKPLHINHMNNLYDATIKLSGILFPAAAFILLDVFFLYRKGRSLTAIWNVVKHLALFLLITLVFLYNEKDLTTGSLYLLPVVLSADPGPQLGSGLCRSRQRLPRGADRNLYDVRPSHRG